MTRTLSQKQKIFLFVVLPIILIIAGTCLSWAQLYREKVSFLSLTFFHTTSELSQWHNNELLSGDKITGVFTAAENHLGMVRVRFDNLYRINDDFVAFRIREASQSGYFYQNRHKVDQFQPGEFFPFGFPEIQDSKGKTYYFEIESESGVTGNAIRLDPLDPVFSTVYKFPRTEILGNTESFMNFPPKKLNSFKGEGFDLSIENAKGIFVSGTSFLGGLREVIVNSSGFIFKKASNLLKTGDYSVVTFFNFLPLILYFVGVHIKLSGLERRRVLVFIPLIVMLLETTLLRQSYDIAYATGIIVWLLVVFELKLGYSVSATLGFFFLALAPILELSGLHFMSIKSAGWAFFLFTLTTLQMAWHLSKSPNRVGVMEFVSQLRKEVLHQIRPKTKTP